ncbi:hypothetical protein Aspvir_007923 [Aspergillus viridinutans]|uniref:Uncharacterized protein n=1 Tax=Aspergillus viridinutans TaxID=75553 RepID=A0A9P3BWL8_ASPVI|nr:uncharacterized protein Aspvir_007923 [Aspergillus viridinutans]GIK03848.1 hypothetical protein Aspvir_007923 [Aspergillus viridinutans]
MCFSDRSQSPTLQPKPVQPKPVEKPQVRRQRTRTDPLEPPPEDRTRARQRDNFPNVHHVRLRSSVEELVSNAPYPTDQARRKNNKRRPKRYNDQERLFRKGSFYEYPTMEYPYKTQNSRGQAYKIVNGKRIDADPSFTRTITDRHKNVQGVIYHPEGRKSDFVRAQQIYNSRTYGPPV